MRNTLDRITALARHAIPPRLLKPADRIMAANKGGLPTMFTPENMYKNYTERARRVVVLSRQEAQAMSHKYIGTEHLLLGLIREADGIAGRVLQKNGIGLEKVREAVTLIIGRGDELPKPEEIGLTPRSKKILELAWDEARNLGHPYIGTEHLLLGLLSEGGGVAVGILESMEVSLNSLRQATLDMLAQTGYAGKSDPAGQSVRLNITSLSPSLALMGQDLTEQARQNKLDPVIGREAEMARLMLVLSRRSKGNPLLIGEPGVGKTALVEGLAQKIVQGDVPPNLRNRRLLSLDTGLLAARAVAYSKNSGAMGDYLERFEQTLAQVRSTNALLFVDEFHLLGAAVSEGGESLVNVLKTAMARGDFQVIGATTTAEYHKFIEPDELAGRFLQPVHVPEPTVEQTTEMLGGLKSRYEEFHNVEIADEAIQAAATLAGKYPSSRHRPDSAIDLLDEAAVMVRARASSQAHPDYKSGLATIALLVQQKQAALTNQDWDLAKEISEHEDQLRAQLAQAAANPFPNPQPTVTKADIVEAVAMLTDTPVAEIEE